MSSSSTAPSTPQGWEPPLPDELQKMLPQYEITGILGRGGMGAVYKGIQSNLDRTVAIKVLPETLAQRNDAMNFAARFKLEAKAMAKLNHPGIISVFDFGETSEGQFYFVMEFVEGMDIQDYLKEHGGILPQKHALSITAHVLDALEYAHSRGIIHRDIKPANILLNNEGQVKIADFGLAKALPTGGEEEAPALTMTNMAVGTPDFVAPEALDCDGIPDHRADIYAVGVMLYRMLTGKLPRGAFDYPSEIRSEIDPRLDDIVEKAMYADPDSRYSTASELRLALDPVITAPTSRLQMDEQKEAETRAIRIAEEGEARALQASEIQLAKKQQAKTKMTIGTAVAVILVIGGLVAFLTNPVVDALKNPPVDKVPIKKPESRVVKTKSSPVTEKPKASVPVKPVKEAPTQNPVLKTAKSAEPAMKPVLVTEAPEGKANSRMDLKSVDNSDNGLKTHPIKEPTKTGPTPAGLKQQKQAELLAIPGLKTRLNGYLKTQNTQVNALAATYLKALDAQLNQAAAAGDLPLVRAFQGEKKLVEELQKALAKPPSDPVLAATEKSTLPPLAKELPGGIVDLRKVWTSESLKIDGTLGTLLQQSLKNLESELTKAHDFDNAEKVMTYRESFGAAVTAIAKAPKPVKDLAPSSAGKTSTALSSATKDKPFENSLGMHFVPVPITGGPSDGKRVLFSIWETRVGDYAAFIKKNKERPWPDAGYKQKDDHPAVNVNWGDAVAFCEWLTERERKKGALDKDVHYRLPTDHEWSCAVGIGKEEDPGKIPSAESGRNKAVYPWGEKLPLPNGAGNYYGEETKRNPAAEGRKLIEGYDDGYDRTSPAGSFEANKYGLYDLGGNVWEWCQDENSTLNEFQVLRGGSWYENSVSSMRSSFRYGLNPTTRHFPNGFRVVMAGTGG